VIELPLVFMAGILGTAHCLGMCGPFALAIGTTAGGWSSAAKRQFVYTAGRVFTYGVLGAVAGYCGARLAHVAAAIVNVPAIFAVLAGLLLVWQGLQAAGWLQKRGVGAANTPCLASGLMGQFLRQPGMSGVFLAGVFTGFLPCGLLYGMVALAMSTHEVMLGATTMVVFGLGTAPAMILAGMSGRIMSIAARKWLYAVAAWCLIGTGVVSVARGVSFLTIGEKPAAGCPLCKP
jgi:sulfite exporter TauE/SafE